MTDQEMRDREQLRLMRGNPSVKKAIKREQAKVLRKNTKPLSRPKRGK